MMFLEHDFYSNFSKSLQSGDSKLTNDIISDELSELIVHDNEKVVDLFTKVNIKASPSISDEEVVDILLDQMQTNEKLQRGLAFLIADRNKLINNQTDDRSGKKYVDYVNQNLKSSFDRVLLNDNEKKKFKMDLMKRIESKDSKVADRRRKVHKTNHFWRNVLIGAVVIGGVVLIVKNWDKITGKEKLGGDAIPQADLGGGEAPKVDLTPSSTPPPTVTPSPTVNG
jgi:hypothetical protein